MLDDLKKWSTIFWGSKPEVTIKNLSPSTCYNFRVCVEKGQWLEFTGATLEGPHLVAQMSRAITFAKTPLIRKIVHAR